MTKPPTFAAALSSHLAQRRLSIRSFADMVGLSHSTIAYIVTGERTPPLEDIDRWTRLLAVPASQAEDFKRLAQSARSKGKRDSAGYVAGIEAKLARIKALHADMGNVLARIASLPTLKAHRHELERLLEQVRDLQAGL